jgi:hypothetical protein
MSQNAPLDNYAGFAALAGGIDSGRSPALLPATQLAYAVNATMRDGFITCRPGWRKRTLMFTDQNGTVDTTTRDRFQTDGRFQGAIGYLADNGTTSLVASIGGRIFQTNTSTYSTQDLTAQAGFTMRSDAPLAWLEQAENYVIIQNGDERPAIFDGASVRLSNTKALGLGDEVPPGEAMAYVKGRLWVTLPGGRSFIAGDLAYSVTNTRADVLAFTENEFLNGGGEFVVPASAGRIRAMRGVALQDSTTGQGPLQVLTTRGAFSVDAPFNREEWAATTSPIQTVSLLSAGAVSHTATVNVNGDIWFRAPDGIRSYVIAHRDHGTWVNTPLSREVSRSLSSDGAALLRHGSAALYDNRLICTCAPYTAMNDEGDVRGIAHRGLVVLDFAPVSSMFNRSQPAWEGLWTGLRVLQLVVTQGDPDRLFAYTLNDDTSTIELWELDKEARFDVETPGTDTRISWSFETPEYGFDTGGWNLRSLGYGDVWFREIAGTLDVTVKYRPDAEPLWQSWGATQICAAYRDCDMTACDTPTTYLPQYRARVRLPMPTDDVDSVTGKPYRHGYRFASRVEVTGYAQIPQFRLVARDMPEAVEGEMPESTCSSTPGIASVCVNDFSYSIS